MVAIPYVVIGGKNDSTTNICIQRFRTWIQAETYVTVSEQMMTTQESEPGQQNRPFHRPSDRNISMNPRDVIIPLEPTANGKTLAPADKILHVNVNDPNESHF